MDENSPMSIIDIMIEVWIIIDFIINIILVAYFDARTNLMVTDHMSIARRYVCNNWFGLICDALAFMYRFHFWGHRSIWGFIFKMIRLWRLFLLHSYFTRLEKDVKNNYFLIRIFKIICITLLALHCGGCISYAIADRHPDPKETWIGSKHADFKKSTLLVKYVTSLYWSTVTFNTTGFGDFSAKTFSEMVFIIVYLLFASGLSLYIGACIIELIVRNTIATMNFRDKVTEVSDFALRNHLPQDLQDLMWSHLSVEFESQNKKHQLVMSSLPRGIRTKIAVHLYLEVVKKSILFQNVPQVEDFLSSLVPEMEPEYFDRDEEVISVKECNSHIYILVSGDVKLTWDVAITQDPFDNDGADVVEILIPRQLPSTGQGFTFGEVGAMFKRGLIIARTLEISHFIKLSRKALVNAIEANPRAGPPIMQNLVDMTDRYRWLPDPFPDPTRTPHHILHGLCTGGCDCPACTKIREAFPVVDAPNQ
ncbi:potassium channel KAT1-like [Lotus japonicus]|uniref:potassium channel KAT1-like n=1 Tax=Lotus japonicus TaxID=34305 RepID=UPI00258FEB8E|nr:potassium channel KAT1-like [Lotus japonicus]XP_057453277.1 potassium channel KAT1-like [Lotus japonicus]XP_057453279.1 potassium channel KAT1-like [Lotus japonicus]